MKPYGMNLHQYRDEDGGPQTKHTGSGYRKRKESRRILSKAARNAAKREIDKESSK